MRSIRQPRNHSILTVAKRNATPDLASRMQERYTQSGAAERALEARSTVRLV